MNTDTVGHPLRSWGCRVQHGCNFHLALAAAAAQADAKGDLEVTINPYDKLIDSAEYDATTVAKYKRWLVPEFRWNERVVDYLLDRYGLAETRTKFCIMDERKTYFIPDDAPDMLYLTQDFCAFFPDFPFSLYAPYLKKNDCDRLTVPRFFLNLDKVAAIEFFLDEMRWRAEANKSILIAAVLGGFRQRMNIEDHPVIHNWLPLNTRPYGTHMIFTSADGMQFAIERFGTLLDKLDAACPAHEWKASALNTDFDRPRN